MLPGIVALVAACLVAGLRLVFAAHGIPGNFVVAGTPLAHLPGLARNVPLHRSGYDGEFFYRLARDPADFARTAFGVTLDDYYRLGRVGYPALVWLVALGGRADLVPSALIVVNVVCLGVLGVEGGALAREAGKHPALGLLIPGYFGFVLSLSRDTAEPLEVALLLGGLLAIRARRPGLAGLALGAAVLTRETASLFIAAIALTEIVRRWRDLRSHRPGQRWTSVLAWVIPTLVFVGWQATVWAFTGHIPIRSDTGNNLGIPLKGLIEAARLRLPELPSRTALLWLAQVGAVLFLWLSALARLVVRRWQPDYPTAPGEIFALLLYVSLMLCVPFPIWRSSSSDLRSFADSATLATVIVISSTPRARLVSLASGVMWAVVAAFRITSL